MNKRQQMRHKVRKAYSDTFYGDGDKPHAAAALVLADLKRFCRVTRGGLVISPVSKTVDPYAVMYQNGLRDAFERIRLMLDFDDTTITEGDSHAENETEIT